MDNRENYLSQPIYNNKFIAHNGKNLTHSPQQISPKKKIKYNGQHFEYQPFQRSIIRKLSEAEQIPSSNEKENRHQTIDNYLKEQKYKRLKIKKEQENQQTKKMVKIKSQLVNLHLDYFKGVQEFKEKQRVQSIQEAIPVKKNMSKKRKRSKRPTSKKQIFEDLINNQKRQQSEHKLRVDYMLLQRNSMPVLHLQSPKLSQNPRASFQSPQQLQTMRTQENMYQSQELNSLQSYSPSVNNLMITDNMSKIRMHHRESAMSQVSINTNNFSQSQQESRQMPYLLQTQPFTLRQVSTQNAMLNSQSNQNILDQKKLAKTTLRIKSGSQLIDLKSEKAIKMFQEFARVRKELSKQLNTKKDTHDQPYKKLKRQASKKKIKRTNMPLSGEQPIQQMKNQFAFQRSSSTEQFPLQQQNYENIPNERTSTAKLQIIEKIQEVQGKLQTHFIISPQTQQHEKQQQFIKQYKPTATINNLSHQQQNQRYINLPYNITTVLKSNNNNNIDSPLRFDNIIQEEESKDAALTSSYIMMHQSSNDAIKDHNNVLQERKVDQNIVGEEQHANSIVEVSQIAKKTEEDEVQIIGHQEINSTNKINNTTFLLKRMYSEEENKKAINYSGQRTQNAVIMIQKHFRGFILRRIMREKLRIDKEFRMLRQKYEVQSNSNSNKTLSSLAFSQSKLPSNFSNPFKLNLVHQQQQISPLVQPINPLLFSYPSSQPVNQQQDKHQHFSPLILNTQQQNQHHLYHGQQFNNQNHSQLLYNKEDQYLNDDNDYEQIDQEAKILASVFKSPTIENDSDNSQQDPEDELEGDLKDGKESGNQQISKEDIIVEVEESYIQPVQLQFLDSQINVNLLKDSEITIPVVMSEIKESQAFEQLQILEEEESKIILDNKSFSNDDNTQRSQIPIEEQIPFIINTDKQLQQQNEQIERKNIHLKHIDFDENISNNQENEDSNLSHHNYLDSPLQLGHLTYVKKQSLIESSNPSSIQLNVKKLIPRHFNKTAEIKPNYQGSQNYPRSQNVMSQQTDKEKNNNISINDESSSQTNFKVDNGQDQSNQQNFLNQDQRIEEQIEAFHSVSNNHGSFQSEDIPKIQKPFIENSPTLQQKQIKHFLNKSTLSNQSKQDSFHSPSHLSNNTLSNNTPSVFDKNSFQNFMGANDKIRTVFKAESEIEQMISDLNKALKKKVRVKEQQLKDEQLSVRTYQRKKIELEKWVDKEQREIKMTKRYFMQGCMRLSSLLENVVKEQGRMKDAVSSMRKRGKSNQNSKEESKSNGGVRRSHSFDSEYQQQLQEDQKNILYGSNKDRDISDGFNTASGRKLSSNLNSSFSEAIVVASQSRNYDNEIRKNQFNSEEIIPLYGVEQQKLFDYKPSNFEIIKSDNDEVEQIIEIKANHENKGSADINIILVDEKNSLGSPTNLKLNNFDDFSNLEDISQSKSLQDSPSKTQGYNSQNSNQAFNSMASQLDTINSNLLQVSDTPLYHQDNNEAQIKFLDPENTNVLMMVDSMENLERDQDNEVNQLVEDILNSILLRDIKHQLFPPRALSKLLKQKHKANSSISSIANSAKDEIQILEGEVKLPLSANSQQPIFEDQIKVLDNILDELSPNSSKSEDKQLQEDHTDNRQGNTPNGVNDNELENKFDNNDRFLQEKEIDDDLEHKVIVEVEIEKAPENNSPNKKGIETGISQVNTYMQDIFDRLKIDQLQMKSVLENVSQPLYKDPLLILAHLQNSIPEPPQQNLNSENDMNENDSDQQNSQPNQFEQAMPFQQSVLSVDLYLDIEKDRRGGLSISQMRDSFHGESSNSQSFMAEMENIHNKAIFDAVNEALDGFRPYGLRGPPLPWSKNSKTLTFKFGKEETFDYLLQKVKYRVLDWSHMAAGTLPPPPSSQHQMTQREKDHLELIREERLARILIQEAEENEPLWVDYEYEETQTKIDVADIILEEMCGEIAYIMEQARRQRQVDTVEEHELKQEQEEEEQKIKKEHKEIMEEKEKDKEIIL